MTDIQLYVDGSLCDVGTSSLISLNKEFDGEREHIVKEAEWSYTIDLPTSDRNREVFGYTDCADVPRKFIRTYDAELYADGLLMLRGKLRLNEIDMESFHGNLYSPAKKTITDILGDKSLNEIIPHWKPMNSLLDITRQNNYVMGYLNSGIPDSQYQDKHVCYPYLLYSRPLNLGSSLDYPDVYTQDLSVSGCGISMDSIFPSFNVLSVIRDMFSTFGYTVSGNVFENERFTGLYQTYQGNYSDYLSGRVTPYYVEFSCNYDNRRNWHNSPTLQVANIWVDNEYKDGWSTFDGRFQYGVDVPLQAGDNNSTVSVVRNNYKMLVKGEEQDGWMVRTPVSGWYRIKCTGNMFYPDQTTNTPEGMMDGDLELVGGTLNDADNTDLQNQPFEFQIKTSAPAENPQLYGFFSSIPMMPSDYREGLSVRFMDKGNTYMKVMSDVRCRRYPKNGKTAIVKDYSLFSISDFVAGARLGGAWFSNQWDAGGDRGLIQRPFRYSRRGAMMALPDVTKAISHRTLDGTDYIQLAQEDDNTRFEYADKTAVVMVRDDSYSNFEGYNTYSDSAWTWDTTSNYGARTYAGAASSSASTTSKYRGNWDINTVVWLNEGDIVNFELLIPYNTQADYTEGSSGVFGIGSHHSKWDNPHYHVNRTIVNFNFKMGIVTTNKDWHPTQNDPIPSFDQTQTPKVTNVNQFLPNIKCNDYLNGFLNTFNLYLTHPSEKVFSIDYSELNDINGWKVDIDQYVHPDEAVYKALDVDNTIQYCFKVDLQEEGYINGNDSPYNTTQEPWDESGYTGEIIISNDSDTSGSIDKQESQWSYNWYKTINFVNYTGMGVSLADIPVICSADNWSDPESKTLETSKTMRLFYISRNGTTLLNEYVEFPYELNGRMWARLVVPSNSIDTGDRSFFLDYSDDPVVTGDRYVGITESFFRILRQSSYQIDIPVALPNSIYQRMRAGAMVYFNDGLYRVKSIEGHDVNEISDGTISLITLN